MTQLRVYLDTTASMRGFALAATANRDDAPAGFTSLLEGVESLRDFTIPNQQPAVRRSQAPALALAGFDMAVSPFAAADSLVQTALGAAAPAPPAVGAVGAVSAAAGTGPRWHSAECPATRPWGGSPAVRSRIDRFYDGVHTCLLDVFEKISANPSASSAHLIVTDAEQNAPDDSAACPSARSSMGIATRLHEWVRDRGNYAALLTFTLPSQPWQAPAVGRAFCAPNRRTLYGYLLTPDAPTAEAIYGALAAAWKGAPGEIAYRPLVPAPAEEFVIEMRLPKRVGRPAAIAPAGGGALTSPETGGLPVFSIRQEHAEAEIQFAVKSVAFGSAETRQWPGFPAADHAAWGYAWQAPQSIGFAAPAPKTAPVAFNLREPQAFELTEPPPSSGDSAASPSPVRVLGHYHAGRKLQKTDDSSAQAMPALTLVSRRRPGAAHGCEVFLVELDTTTRKTDQGAAAQTVQTSLVATHAPILRFLLHIDY